VAGQGGQGGAAGKEEAIPDLLEARERAFYETIDDHAGGLA